LFLSAVWQISPPPTTWKQLASNFAVFSSSVLCYPERFHVDELRQ
jgi:hypothetical protein